MLFHTHTHTHTNQHLRTAIKFLQHTMLTHQYFPSASIFSNQYLFVVNVFNTVVTWMYVVLWCFTYVLFEGKEYQRNK